MEVKIDEEYFKIAYSAANRFSKNITEVNLTDCIYNGIHEAIMSFDEKKGKITTHIFNRVTFQCKNFIRKNKNITFTNDFKEKKQSNYKAKFDISLTEILIDKYVYKLPNDCIADKYNITIPEAKRRIRTGKKILKKLFLNQKLLKD